MAGAFDHGDQVDFRKIAKKLVSCVAIFFYYFFPLGIEHCIPK